MKKLYKKIILYFLKSNIFLNHIYLNKVIIGAVINGQ